jgi:hypothetical protein
MFRTEETHAGKAPGFKLLSVVSEWYQNPLGATPRGLAFQGIRLR